MFNNIKENDIIISACPDFILSKIIKKIGISKFICSEVDLNNKKVIYLNFWGNKVKRYKEIYGNRPIDCFYTASSL